MVALPLASKQPGLHLKKQTPLVNLARSLEVDLMEQEEAVSLLVKENVRRQVKNVAETETIKKAWARGDHVQIHGLMYELSTGSLSDLGMLEAP